MSCRTLVTGALAAASSRDASFAVATELRERFSARSVALVDSGTSALVVALRLLAGPAGVVALPAYSCVDIAAAALYAGVRVRLYDVDPSTLSPDLDSVRRVLAAGAAAIVVVHLFGLAADVHAVARLAETYGAAVIEDAAQAAGATIGAAPLGSFGRMSVLSFGRGKGVTGGAGGALLGFSPDDDGPIHRVASSLPHVSRGGANVAMAGAQWLFGRPWLYGIPASARWLHLGEMVYHAAHEPRQLSIASAAMVRRGFMALPRELAARRRNAAWLLARCGVGNRATPILPLPDTDPAYLRLPIRGAGLVPVARLGIVRPYPRTLDEHRELHNVTCAGQARIPGARELSRQLVTLPTHSRLTARDLAWIERWLATTRDA